MKHIYIFIIFLFKTNLMFSQFKGDTLIVLNKNTKITFDKTNVKYDSINYFFSNPIIKIGKTKTKVYNSDYSFPYSELNLAISPNKKYILLDRIEYGYVYLNDSDSILHQNYFCDIINLKSAKIEMSLQSECDGHWNSLNQFVKPNGKVIFSNKSR